MNKYSSKLDEPSVYKVIVIDPTESLTLGEWYLTKGDELMDLFDRGRYGVISSYEGEGNE